MHHVSPKKMIISNIVDRPDTLNRQNNSQPSTRMAESQATLASNNFRARKNVSTTTTSKSTSLNNAIRKSGSYRQKFPPLLQKALLRFNG